MAELQREFQNQTVDLDFSDGLDERFGAEETTVIGKNQLDSFLMGDPVVNADDIQKVETPTPPTQQPNKVDKSKPKETQIEVPEDNEEDKSDILKNWLSGEMNKKDEEQKPDEQTQTEEQDNETEPEADDENQFSLLSKSLTKLGIFTTDEDEEGNEIAFSTKDPKEFKKRWELEKEKGAQTKLYNFLNQHGDEYNDLFVDVFVKGATPEEYVKKFVDVKSMKGLDLTNVSNQEKVFVNYYRSQGVSEERIQKRLEKAKDYGDLEDDAKDFHQVMVQQEEKSLTEMANKKAEENQIRQQRELAYQESVGKILQAKMQAGDFDGIPVTKKEAQEGFNYMTVKPYKLPTGELITEMQKDWLELDRPENHELKVKIGLILKAKGDLSKIKKKAVSDKSDDLFGDLTGKKTQKSRKEGTPKITGSFFD